MDGVAHNKKKKNASVEESTQMLSELNPEQESGSPMLLELYRCTSTGVLVSDGGTQTEYCKYLLSAKIETMLLRNEFAKMKIEHNPSTKIVSNFSYEAISQIPL